MNVITINIHAAGHGVTQHQQDSGAHPVQKPWNWDAKVPVITLTQHKKGTMDETSWNNFTEKVNRQIKTYKMNRDSAQTKEGVVTRIEACDLLLSKEIEDDSTTLDQCLTKMREIMVRETIYGDEAYFWTEMRQLENENMTDYLERLEVSRKRTGLPWKHTQKTETEPCTCESCVLMEDIMKC